MYKEVYAAFELGGLEQVRLKCGRELDGWASDCILFVGKELGSDSVWVC